jgi:hypothetical protein
MKKATWKNRIIESCRAAGTYREFFLPVIDTLAGILEKRDEAQEMFKASGGNILVKHTNKGGATNIEQNPALRLINDLNRDALAYWRDLGLTPAGLKKIDEEAMKPKKQNTLDKVLMDLA